MEKKVWILEDKDKSPVVVYFDNEITIGEAWSIWKKSKEYGK